MKACKFVLGALLLSAVAASAATRATPKVRNLSQLLVVARQFSK